MAKAICKFTQLFFRCALLLVNLKRYVKPWLSNKQSIKKYSRVFRSFLWHRLWIQVVCLMKKALLISWKARNLPNRCFIFRFFRRKNQVLISGMRLKLSCAVIGQEIWDFPMSGEIYVDFLVRRLFLMDESVVIFIL